MITSNLRLVVKIALDFQKYWMKNLLDLIQEGNIGLMQAIRKFDPYRGIKLSYYASFWIKAYILKFIMDNWKLVKIGTTQAQRKLFYNLKREKEKLRAQGFEPGPKLLADALNVREEEVVEMDQRLGGWELSLDAPLKEGSDEYHKNFLPTHGAPGGGNAGPGGAERHVSARSCAEFRRELNDKELDILDLRLLAEKAPDLAGDRRPAPYFPGTGAPDRRPADQETAAISQVRNRRLGGLPQSPGDLTAGAAGKSFGEHQSRNSYRPICTTFFQRRFRTERPHWHWLLILWLTLSLGGLRRHGRPFVRRRSARTERPG